MLTLERVALELLEFKIDALANRHSFRGGVTGLWELHRIVDHGLQALTTEERQRFTECGRRLRALSELATRGTARHAQLDTLSLGSEDTTFPDPRLTGEGLLETDTPVPQALSREALEEHRALQRLAERVEREELDDLIGRLSAAWRAERERITPRLVYATIRNLQRFVSSAPAGAVLSVRAFRVAEPLPERQDPLISLSDLDSLAEIGRDLVDLILSIGVDDGRFGRLDVPEAQAMAVVRQIAVRVAEDPYGGRLSSFQRKGPTSGELRTAIQELSKERLPETQRAVLRNDLEARLADALAFERQQRQTFQRDVARNLEAIRALFERLEPSLPARVGGGAGPTRLQGGVLFAVSPAVRWDRVPHGAEAVTLRMVGPVRFTLGGHGVAVMGTGDSRTLFVDDAPHPLEDAMVVPAGRGVVRVDREGEYLHLRWRDAGRSVAARLAEAQLVAHVLTHPHHEPLLKVLGAIAQVETGSPTEVVVRAWQAAGTVTAGAPNRRTALEGLVRGAAQAAGVTLEENTALGLVQRLQATMATEPGDLATLLERETDGEGVAHPVGDEPVTFEVGPLRLTARRYRRRGRSSSEQVVVMLPGQVVSAFNAVAVEDVPGGVLVCAASDTDVALLFLRDRSLRVKVGA